MISIIFFFQFVIILIDNFSVLINQIIKATKSFSWYSTIATAATCSLPLLFRVIQHKTMLTNSVTDFMFFKILQAHYIAHYTAHTQPYILTGQTNTGRKALGSTRVSKVIGFEKKNDGDACQHHFYLKNCESLSLLLSEIYSGV